MVVGLRDVVCSSSRGSFRASIVRIHRICRNHLLFLLLLRSLFLPLALEDDLESESESEELELRLDEDEEELDEE